MSLKRFFQNKIVKYLFLIIYLGIITWVFVPHFIHNLQVGNVPKATIVNCSKEGKTFQVKITDKEFNPKITSVKICDVVIFKNVGTKYYDPAFGDHPVHLNYPGFVEKILKPHDINKVVMSASGEFKIHEHIYDQMEGEIIVRSSVLFF